MSACYLRNKKYFGLREENEFIKRAIDNRISIIEVCLGAQLISKISGGKIEELKDEFNKSKLTIIRLL